MAVLTWILTWATETLRIAELKAAMVSNWWTLYDTDRYKSPTQIWWRYVFIYLTNFSIHVYDDDWTWVPSTTQIWPSSNLTWELLASNTEYHYRIDNWSVIIVQKDSAIWRSWCFWALYENRWDFYTWLVNAYTRYSSWSKDCYYKEWSADKANYILAWVFTYVSWTNDRNVLKDFCFYNYNDFQINYSPEILNWYDLRNELWLVFPYDQFVSINNVQYLAYKIWSWPNAGRQFLLFKWE